MRIKFFLVPFFIFIVLFFVLNLVAHSFENEWAIYGNLNLSPDEDKLVFECHLSFEEYETMGHSELEKHIFSIDICDSQLNQITLASEDFKLSPDKSKVLVKTFFGLHLLDLQNRKPPKWIFNRFPSIFLSWDTSPIYEYSWSPDSKKFFLYRALGWNGKKIASIFDAETYEEQVLKREGNQEFGGPIQWLPDGNTFIFVDRYEIQTWNFSTKTWDLLASGLPEEPCYDPHISPNGERTLYKYQDAYKITTLIPREKGKPYLPREKRIVCRVIDLPDWTEEELNESLWSNGSKEVIQKMDHLVLDGTFNDVKLNWSPDGEKILIKGKEQLWIYGVFDSTYTPLFCDSNSIQEAIWSKDQKKIFFVTFYREDSNKDGILDHRDKAYGTLKNVNVASKDVNVILEKSEPIRNLTFSSDGNLLAFEKGGNVWILKTATNKLYQLTFDGGTNPNWLKDDKEILFENDSSLYIIDKDGKNLTRISIAKGKNPLWFPDGKSIAVESKGRFWKVALNELKIEQIENLPESKQRLKGEIIEVFLKEIKSNIAPTVNEIWAKDIQTSKEWKLKDMWKNWTW